MPSRRSQKRTQKKSVKRKTLSSRSSRKRSSKRRSKKTKTKKSAVRTTRRRSRLSSKRRSKRGGQGGQNGLRITHNTLSGFHRTQDFGSTNLNKRRDIIYAYLDVTGERPKSNIEEAITEGNHLSTKALKWYRSPDAMDQILRFAQRCNTSKPLEHTSATAQVSGSNDTNDRKKQKLIQLIRDNCNK